MNHVSISCFSHATVVNQYKSSESMLYCFYNMFLPLLGHHQVKTRVHCSQTTLANVHMLHLLLSVIITGHPVEIRIVYL
jgi:hypothetical protein